MRCSNCEFENPAGMKFCGKCRTLLALTCLSCSFENPAGFDFCGQCGASLTLRASTPVSATSPIQSPEVLGERRHLTVLFCDLVGSTAIAARLDPEQWRDTLAGFHRAAAEAITRFDGHVAKYLGDGVMAYFGWPAAHDNDAERAARAGLAILYALMRENKTVETLAASALDLCEKHRFPNEAALSRCYLGLVCKFTPTETGK